MASNDENRPMNGRGDENKTPVRRHAWHQYGPLREMSPNISTLVEQRPRANVHQTTTDALVPRERDLHQTAVASSGQRAGVQPRLNDFHAALPKQVPEDRALGPTAMWPSQPQQLAGASQPVHPWEGLHAKENKQATPMVPETHYCWSGWLAGMQASPGEAKKQLPAARPQATHALTPLATSSAGAVTPSRLQYLQALHREQENDRDPFGLSSQGAVPHSPAQQQHQQEQQPIQQTQQTHQTHQTHQTQKPAPTYSAVASAGHTQALATTGKTRTATSTTPRNRTPTPSATASIDSPVTVVGPLSTTTTPATSSSLVPIPAPVLDSDPGCGLASTDAATGCHPPPRSPGPSAPGFGPTTTGYEFELNHDGNRDELRRQKLWAAHQLGSCKENERYHHTQTTACVAAVNGQLVGPYSPESLYRYGTDADAGGLRVTMTLFKTNSGGSGSGGCDSNGESATLLDAELRLRFQIIVPPHGYRSSSCYNGSSHVITATASKSPGSAMFAPGLQSSHRMQHSSSDSMGSDSTISTNTSTTSGSGSCGTNHVHVIPMGPSRTFLRYSIPITPPPPPPVAIAIHNSSRSKGRRYDIAFATIPLRGGIPGRPGYRPLNERDAIDRIRTWGGQPDRGVFGNAWLIHMAVEQRQADLQMEEGVLDKMLAREGRHHETQARGPAWGLTGADITRIRQTVQTVHTSMTSLLEREGTLSILLSNHWSQKRIARQCPDLVAMWLMAQENL